MTKKHELSGIAIIICMFIGLMIMILIILFVKKQIIRFTLKNRRGPHCLIGTDAPKFLKNEIERKLALTKQIKTEPLLINGLEQFSEFQSLDEVPTDHFYRMKAIDKIKELEDLISKFSKENKRSATCDIENYLINLTKNNGILYKFDLKVLYQFIDLYNHARYEALPVFLKNEFNNYIQLLTKIKKFIYSKYTINENLYNKLIINQDLACDQTPVNRSTNLIHKDKTQETCV